MRGLADRGKTVLVSSHILSEVEQVADTVTIIGRGHLLAEGTVAEILARGAESACRVVVADPGRAARILTGDRYAVERAPGPVADRPRRRLPEPAPIRPGSPRRWPARACTSASWSRFVPTSSRSSSASPPAPAGWTPAPAAARTHAEVR